MNEMAFPREGPPASAGPMNPFASNPSMGMMGSGVGMGGMGGMVEDFSRMPAPLSRMPGTVYDPMPGIPGEVVVAERIEEPTYLGERFLGQEWIYGVKPYVTMEKMVEVPQTIVKERVRHVPKPEIVERVIEVPKVGYTERTLKAAPKTVTKHGIDEVHRGVVSETMQRQIPGDVKIQERLIEIPKMEYREIIEYEDRIEYREVPVDKIIEVPEIEYVIRPVERYVPQTYVQEYFVDTYTEVPVAQIQEVENYQYVPVIQPVPNYIATPVPTKVPIPASQGMNSGMMGGMGMSGRFPSMPGPMETSGRFAPGMMPGLSMRGMNAVPGSMNMGNTMNMGNAFASYDPTRFMGTGVMR